MAKVVKPMTYQMRKAKGSHGKPVQFPAFDSPLDHGWSHYKLDQDGVIIWELRIEHKTIAALKPQLDKVGCDVAILRDGQEPEWFEFNNLDYEYITGKVKEIYAGRGDFLDFVDGPVPFEDDQIFSEAIHWDGDLEDCQPDPNVIPFQGEPVQYPEGIF